MKEQEFLKKYKTQEVVIPFYYFIDEDKDIYLDVEEMQRQLNNKIKELQEFLK